MIARKIRVTDDLCIRGLELSPIRPDDAVHLAVELLRKASRRIVLDATRPARRQAVERRINR
jgi:hypothetical protein